MYGVFTFSLETMTKEQIDYIIQLVEENGVEELERTIESLLFRIPKDQVVCDGSISVSVNSIEKQFDIELKNESLSCMEKAVTAVYPKHTVTYHQETLTNVNNPNSTVTCLYYAHVFMHYLQSGSTIQGIQDKDFWYTDLTPNFDIHLDSLQPYIASGGWMCRVKAYYTISRDMTEGLFNVHFSRSTTDYAVAYASDH